MARTLRPGGGDGGEYSGDAPPFLQTHPVTSERIAEAKARAHVIEEQNPAALLNAPRATDKGEYPLIRERVRVLSAQDFNDMVAYYARNLARGGDFVTPAHRYGYALALQRAGQPQKAVDILTQLLAANPDSSTLQLGLADADLAAGH